MNLEKCFMEGVWIGNIIEWVNIQKYKEQKNSPKIQGKNNQKNINLYVKKSKEGLINWNMSVLLILI